MAVSWPFTRCGFYFRIIDFLFWTHSGQDVKERSEVISKNSTYLERKYCLHSRKSNKTQHKADNCWWHNRFLECYGDVTNLASIKINQVERTRHIALCGWPNEIFNSSILTRFPMLKTLHIQYGELSYFEDSFPSLKNLKVWFMHWMNSFFLDSKEIH